MPGARPRPGCRPAWILPGSWKSGGLGLIRFVELAIDRSDLGLIRPRIDGTVPCDAALETGLAATPSLGSGRWDPGGWPHSDRVVDSVDGYCPSGCRLRPSRELEKIWPAPGQRQRPTRVTENWPTRVTRRYRPTRVRGTQPIRVTDDSAQPDLCRFGPGTHRSSLLFQLFPLSRTNLTLVSLF